MDLLEDLRWRGLIHQQTDEIQLREHLASPRVVYCGFDPTAPSLTVGNLVALLLLARFQRAGHRPVVLMGGGTGLIGDPSGKSAERPVLSDDQVRANVEGQRPIFEGLLSFGGANAASIVNNVEWLGRLGFLQVLRDVGKHFSVNMMIQKDSVRERLNNREQGISYTEFSYMLLQAYDFQYLFEQRGVTVQVAGSDQWGNIVAGIDLIRRTSRGEAFGLTAPLVTKADGGKFGKSESGAVWLTRDRTSPYAFYQFWMNTLDADVPRYLRVFTLLDRATIEALEAAHLADPGSRRAHQALASHMTMLVFGEAGLVEAEAATAALFSGDVRGLSRDVLDEVFSSAPSSELSRSLLEGEGMASVDFFAEAGAAKSKREARDLLTAGAFTVNGRRVSVGDRIRADWLLHGDIALVRRGKKHWYVVRIR